mgnify:CR=1 FL=1
MVGYRLHMPMKARARRNHKKIGRMEAAEMIGSGKIKYEISNPVDSPIAPLTNTTMRACTKTIIVTVFSLAPMALMMTKSRR